MGHHWVGDIGLWNGGAAAGQPPPADFTNVHTSEINGNTIMGNYQAANNTILVTGNQIAGNYQAANSTILVTGNTIAGND